MKQYAFTGAGLGVILLVSIGGIFYSDHIAQSNAQAVQTVVQKQTVDKEKEQDTAIKECKDKYEKITKMVSEIRTDIEWIKKYLERSQR